MTAKVHVRFVALFDEIGYFCGWGTAVVGGENDERVVGDLVIVESLEDLAYYPIGFHDEVAVFPDGRFSLKFLRWNDGCVWAC